MTGGLKSIFSVWGQNEGYVFVPVKVGSRWIERSFYWPDERSKIKKWVKLNIKERASVYWCPTIFNKPKRIKDNIKKKINLLWADLDEVHPSEIELRPTIAWESSPKRYQCLWLLKKELKAEKAEKLNKALTYSVGADKGGWDLTQVLRIPGLRNWKYKNGPKGRLMWDDGQVYSRKDIIRAISKDERIIEDDGEGKDKNISKDIRTILYNYKRTLSPKVYELFFTPEDEVSVGERSDRLWELECLLAEAGVKTKDIITLVKLSPWNKFEGRRNEDEQIENEVYKAKDKVKALGSEVAISSGPTEVIMTPRWINYEDIMSSNQKKPEYLVEEVWQDKSHGFVAGEPKTYKSIISTDLAVSVASGKPFLGQFEVVNPGPVLIIQEENHPYLIQDRLVKMASSKGLLEGKVRETKRGLKITFPPILPIRFLNQYGFDLTKEESREVLENEIKRFKPVLVIFDPLYLMLGGTDENNSKELRPILNWLLQIRYAFDTGIMLVHHWNKSGMSGRGGQRMLGSTTLHAWVESALYCSIKNEQDHCITVERELRSFPKPKNINVTFKMGDPGDPRYEVITTDSKLTSEEILSSMSSIPKSVSELSKLLNMDRSSVQRKMEKLIKEGKVERIGGDKGRGKETSYRLIIREANDNNEN